MRGNVMVTLRRNLRPANDGQLLIEIKNGQPIELLDLTSSLAALGAEYLRHLEREHPEDAAAEVTLYLNEIKSGSVLATVMAASPQLLQGISYANSLYSFTKNLKTAYDFLASAHGAAKPDLDKKTLTNLNHIVEPIAKDRGSQLNIGTLNGDVHLHLTSDDASRVQNRIARLLKDEEDSTTRYHEKVLLYWFQARADARSTSGDKGVIESIAAYPVKVICATDGIKAEMVLEHENPFREAYIVDVAVETIKQRPAVYKIMKLHEKVPREDAA